jgi:hypothetical protein
LVVKLGMNAALKASTALSATHRFLGTAPLHLAPAALLALALLSAPIFAQDITWTGALSSVWDRTTTGNWTPNSVPYTGGERAVFTASPTTTTVQVTENVSPGGIVFDATAPSYVITLGDHTNITGDVENASGREQTITVLSTKQLAFSGSAARPSACPIMASLPPGRRITPPACPMAASSRSRQIAKRSLPCAAVPNSSSVRKTSTVRALSYRCPSPASQPPQRGPKPLPNDAAPSDFRLRLTHTKS